MGGAGQRQWMLTSLGFIWDFNSYFHSPPLSQVLFFLNPTYSVLCRSAADLITFTRLSHIFSLSLFPSFDVIKNYFHATPGEEDYCSDCHLITDIHTVKNTLFSSHRWNWGLQVPHVSFPCPLPGGSSISVMGGCEGLHHVSVNFNLMNVSQPSL